MTIEIRCQRGQEVRAWLPAVAQLRIQVFAAYPYLYRGDLDYEQRYLDAYAQSADALFVLVLDAGRVVGASTGIPLADDDAAFQQPFRQQGMDPGEVFYCGESVLDPAYRGQGLGHRFFDAREAHARALGRFNISAFCAVERDPQDPRRPPDYRSNDLFWRKRGYQRQSGLQCTLDWPEIGSAAAVSHRLAFWTRRLAAV